MIKIKIINQPNIQAEIAVINPSVKTKITAYPAIVCTAIKVN